MSSRAVRADLSALGFYLVLYIILVSAAAGGIMTLFMIAGYLMLLFLHSSALWDLATAGKDAIWFTLVVNAVSQYLIGMPVMAYIIRRRLPTIEVRQGLPGWYEVARMQPDTGMRKEDLGVRQILVIIPVIVFLMAAGDLIGSGLAWLLGDAAGIEAQNSQVELILSGNLAVTILFVVILAPIAEELFFRKLLVDQLRPLSRRGAVLVSAVSFAFSHQNIYQFFYTLFIGALFAFLYLKTEKILVTILLHIGVNFYGGIVLPELTKGLGEELALQTAEEMTAVAAASFYYLLAAAGLVLFLLGMARGWFRIREDYGAVPDDAFLGAYFTAPGQLVFMLSCAGLSVANLLLL